jgi:uncharacterized protein YbaR (Trm112 family)
MSRRLTTEEFVKRARKVHENFYDYSLVDYKNAKAKVTIICPIHGEFKQTASDHLNSCGCPKCAKQKLALSYALTTEEFVERAKKVHQNKYSYNKVQYKNAKTKIELVCKTCGYTFQITPDILLQGCGCPYCTYAEQCKNKPVHLYYISINNGEFYKIGVTYRDIKERFYGYDLNYQVLLWEEYKRPQDAMYKEQQILEEFGEFKYKGEEKVLKYSGDSELFTKDILGLDK